jgi:soluble lytic murein transglycosylase-like protein
LALGAALVSGCSTTSSEMQASLAMAPAAGEISETGSAASMIETAGYSYDGEAQLDLPETIAVLPSSYAGPSPEQPYQVAALMPADPGPAATVNDAETNPVLEPETADRPDMPRGELDELISKYAAFYEVPEELVRRVVRRESNFNPTAHNRGHWGLMQIKHATARGMGYDGPAQGLLDAETNLKFAVKYLRGAFLVARGDQNRADRFYQSGYYYDAKRMGLLEETGLGRDRRRKRV